MNEAIQVYPHSEKLSLKRKWEADEYGNDWESYEDEKRNRKADKKVKKTKRQAYIDFHSQLDERLSQKDVGTSIKCVGSV